MSLTIVCRVEECPAYLNRDKPLRVKEETAHAFVFECATCLNIRGVAKQKIGGTIGAGRRDDQPATRFIGRGM